MAAKRAALIIAIIISVSLLCLLFGAKRVQPGHRPELIGKMKCNNGELTVELNSSGISLYTPNGELKAHYKPEDKGAQIISCCIADIESDSAEELFVIEGNGNTFYGNRLVLLCYDNGLKKLYDREFEELNPWKIQTCDVDGDGRKEIALGVYKKANFHPVMAKRPFLYHWDKGDIVPFWRGSRLSRPFSDYCFYDLDRDSRDELLAIEELPDGRKLINAYSWKGFGFESIAESSPYEDITALKKQCGEKDGILVQTVEDGQGSWIRLEKIDERLVEEVE